MRLTLIVSISAIAIFLSPFCSKSSEKQPAKRGAATANSSKNIIASPSVMLSYNLKANEEYDYAQRTSIKQSLGATGMNATMESGNNITYNVLETNRDNFKIKTQFSDLKISLEGLSQGGMPDTAMEVPFQKDDFEEFFITPKGVVTIVRKPEKSSASRDGRIKSLKEAALKSTKYIYPTFPESPVTVGESWTFDDIDEIQSVKSKISYKYTLSGIIDTLGKKCAVISIKTTKMTLAGTITQMGMKINLEGDGSTSGRLVTEIATGMQIAGRVETHLDMRAAVGDSELENMSINMETINAYSRKMK